MAPATIYSADILNFFIPTPSTRLGRSLLSNIAAHFSGNYCEEGAYLGIPLILIILHYAATKWNDKHTKPLIIVFFLSLTFSLGSYLHVNGVITHIPLPWLLVSKIPFMNSALPLRLSLYTSLLAAIILSMWLCNNRSAFNSVVKYAVAAIACAFLWPNQSFYHWGKPYIPALFNHVNVKKYFSRGDNVLLLSSSATYYQIVAKMKFRLYDNYLGFNPSAFHEHFNPYIFSHNYLIKLEGYCAKHDINRVVAVKTTKQDIIDALHKLSWPHITVGKSEIYHVPINLSTVYLSGEYFGLYPFAKSFHWMGRNLKVVSVHKNAILQLSGKYLPKNIIERVTIHLDGTQITYLITQPTMIALRLQPDSVATITALNTFVPHLIIPGSTDTRHLSVLVKISRDQ